MRYFQWQKIIEGIIFQGLDTSLDTSRTSSDLRGRLRPRLQIRPPKVFEAVTSNRGSDSGERSEPAAGRLRK